VKPQPHAHVVAWIQKQVTSELCTSAVTEAEIFYGIELLSKGKRREGLLKAEQAMFIVTPDALHPIPANMPAGFLQQCGNSPLAIATILTGQLDDRFCQRIFSGSMHRLVALRGTPLTD